MTKTLAQFAWPGGYTITYLTKENDILCYKCAQDEEEEPTAFIHWEGPPNYCDECYVELPSEYGDPDEQ